MVAGSVKFNLVSASSNSNMQIHSENQKEKVQKKEFGIAEVLYVATRINAVTIIIEINFS